MKIIWQTIRAFIRGPSDDELDRDLEEIEQRLRKMEDDYEAERDFLLRNTKPFFRFLVPPSIRRGGSEG